MTDSICNTDTEAKPADFLRYELLKIIRPLDTNKDMERIVDALFAYFWDGFDNNILKAEQKTSAANYTIELRDREIKDLSKRVEACEKLLKESGIKEEMWKMRKRLDEISYAVIGLPNG